MMTEPDGMYGEEIRQALSAAANFVVPDGDGLDKIRQRTRRRSPAFAWLVAYSTYLPRALVNMVRVPGSELVLMAKGQSTVFKRPSAERRDLGNSPGPSQKPRSPQQWLRPVIAAAGALVFVVAVLLAVPRLRQTITTSALTNPGASASATTGNGGPGGIGETAGATQDKIGPAPDKSGFGITMPPPGAGRNGKCATSGTSGSHDGRSGTENSGKTSHCPSGSPSPGSSSPGSSTGSGSGSPSSPPSTGSTTPIPPSGGGTPTPTTSAVSNSPNPGDTGS
jgi:hypothetical protein